MTNVSNGKKVETLVKQLEIFVLHTTVMMVSLKERCKSDLASLKKGIRNLEGAHPLALANCPRLITTV